MTDEMNYESQPVKHWEHRNIKCALYCLRIPDDSRWIGYARFGDRWIDVLDTSGTDPTSDPDRMIEAVEQEVDSLLEDIGEDDDDSLLDFDEPIDPYPKPDPFPQPDPNPDPFPQPDPKPGDGPYWMSVVGPQDFIRWSSATSDSIE